MSKLNPNISLPKPPPSSLANLTNSLITTQDQLVDSLTSHISLYHSHFGSSPNPNSAPRSSILKWFSSLSVPQRQAHLTTVNRKFTHLLIQMLGKLRTNGYGRFIILPDLPSGDLPSLCYKKSTGLLSRTAESNHSERLVFDSTRLFGSREGESADECSCSINCFDSMTVCEDLVEDVENFVLTMDNVSGGGFLRGEESELGAEWVELEWLKARGYYSIEAFVVNQLEVALRIAWLNSAGANKKRGVKLKEKMSIAGVAANVFWRKKGCLDWWAKLDAQVRRKIITFVLGKASKILTREILKEASVALGDRRWLFRLGAEQPRSHIFAESPQRNLPNLPADAEFGLFIMPASVPGIPASITNMFSSLSVIREIFTLISPYWHGDSGISAVFFTTLTSVNMISDCMMRKLRGHVMAIYLDYTKLELLEEGTFVSPSKHKEKHSPVSQTKKGKSKNVKKMNHAAGKELAELSIKKSLKDPQPVALLTEVSDYLECKKTSCTHDAEHCQGPPLGKGGHQSTARKKRGRSKHRNSGYRNKMEGTYSEGPVAEHPPCNLNYINEATKLEGRNDDLNVHLSDGSLAYGSHLALNTTLKSSAVESYMEDVQGSEENGVVGHIGDEAHGDSLSDQSVGILTRKIGTNETSHDSLLQENETVAGDINVQSQKAKENTSLADKPVQNLKEKLAMFHKRGIENFSAAGHIGHSQCFPSEGPSLGHVYFPSISANLPPATDRLHLDVGFNWHNRMRQPFVPTVHQAGSSPVEVGCNQMISRPLPMSLDWPPMVRRACSLTPPVTCNYDSSFISRRQAAFQKGFTAQNVKFNAKTIDDDASYSGDILDLPETANGQEPMDEYESHWLSEEEFEVHGIDYNQYFGGGVMYWNPSDYPGTGFSRPPSLSSDDSSWAWHEADMNRTVDDMVAFSSSYSTNGLTSPTAASFCSPFEPLGSGHQALGYVVSGSEVTGKVQQSTTIDIAKEEKASGSLTNLSGDLEGKVGDAFPYPILRPIIIPNISREKPRAVPPSRREQPRIKRPPSPVVLCVPRAPRPPPPSPVSDSRKQRGFPTVRSGSSSPRHWGMRGFYHDGINLEEACVRMDGTEVVWPSWRNKNLATRPMIQPLPGTLLQDRLIAISQLARDQEHPDVTFPVQPPDLLKCPARKASLSLMHALLHDEIDIFCKQVASATMARKPFINWAVKRVARSLQVLWPRSRTNVFGSNATGLSLPSSDVDLVICLPPVRNLEPIKEAGILEGRNGIKETCLQHAARYLANQEWVKSDSLKTVENTAIPIIMLVVEVPNDLSSSSTSAVQKECIAGGTDPHLETDVFNLEESPSLEYSGTRCDNLKDVESVRLDISFKSPSHTGLQTTELVKELTEQFPAATPLALVLKKFLADRSLDQSYSGGLSSYCLVIFLLALKYVLIAFYCFCRTLVVFLWIFYTSLEMCLILAKCASQCRVRVFI
ncbi:Non-canonical poly(A) RNA polymerase protein Trf4-1 [Linum perenne]